MLEICSDWSGRGEESEKLMKLAKDLVASGVVDIPQAGLEVLPYLREANIGVLLSAPCHKEGLSNSIMEYMACEYLLYVRIAEAIRNWLSMVRQDLSFPQKM